MNENMQADTHSKGYYFFLSLCFLRFFSSIQVRIALNSIGAVKLVDQDEKQFQDAIR